MLETDEIQEMQAKLFLIKDIKCSNCHEALPFDNVELTRHWLEGPWIFRLRCFCGWRAGAFVNGENKGLSL